MLQKKLSQDWNPKKQPQNQVKRNLWGHKTKKWIAQGYQIPSTSGCCIRPDAPPEIKKQRKVKNQSKPYSIPFQPKPLNLFVKKSYIKPPPKLAPAYSTTPVLTVASQPVACGSVNFERSALNDADINIMTRELFADTLERTIVSNDIVHSQFS